MDDEARYSDQCGTIVICRRHLIGLWVFPTGKALCFSSKASFAVRIFEVLHIARKCQIDEQVCMDHLMPAAELVGESCLPDVSFDRHTLPCGCLQHWCVSETIEKLLAQADVAWCA